MGTASLVRMRVASLVCLLTFAVSIFSGCLGGTDGVGQTVDTNALPEGALTNVTRHTLVDGVRWSGEPSILVLDDGTILITGVSGFTRYAEDPSDIPARFGQSYIWRSTDDGQSFQFVDAGVLPHPVDGYLFYRNAIMGVEGDLAADEAGNAYFVDLTMLAADGLSVSGDGGESWMKRQNPVVGLPGVDRPWVAAHGDGEVYVKYLQMGTGHRVARSTDGGLTFLEDVAIPACSQADMTVDFAKKEVLVPCTSGGEISVVRTGPGEMAWERIAVRDPENPVTGGFPGLAVSFERQYVIVYVEREADRLLATVQVTFDGGETWTDPMVVSDTNASAIFPWVDANPDGQVAVVWYQADQGGDPNDVDATWVVKHASFQMDRETETISEPTVIQLSEGPIHQGSICSAGLGCVTDGRAEDRRLLDFFEVDVTADGRSHVTWTSTQTEVPTVWYGQVTADGVVKSTA